MIVKLDGKLVNTDYFLTAYEGIWYNDETEVQEPCKYVCLRGGYSFTTQLSMSDIYAVLTDNRELKAIMEHNR